MVETISLQDEDEFVDVASDNEDCELNEGQLSELWELYTEYRSEQNSDAKLIMVPEWFSENEFEAGRRPYVFAEVEHDDESSGAVLWSSAELVDISIVENKVFSDFPIDRSKDGTPIEESVEALDISAVDDYIDEPGKIWIPRSLATVFDLAG